MHCTLEVKILYYLPNTENRMGSVPKDALKALPTVDFVSEGIRITPCNMFSWIIR